jgi:ABC-type sugar transport system ATPase subunit
MLAGLEQVSGGAIEIDGKNVTGMLPLERGVAMVFQSYALYPHMTVEDNIGFGLKIAGLSRAERRPKVLEAARILKLEDYLGRKPKQLSGGQRQRVAIGRAIVKQPKIFLFDEPLSNLDAELRVQMRLEIARLHQDLGATMIYVTHDQVEAMTLADKIVVLRDGRIEQVGAPIELYEKPANVFVAGFIGSPKMNFFEIAAGPDLHSPQLGEAIIQSATSSSASPKTLGIRPEHVAIDEAGPFAGIVKVVEQLGSVSYLYVETPAGATITVEQRRLTGVRVGDAIRFALEREHVHLFDVGGKRL